MLNVKKLLTLTLQKLKEGPSPKILMVRPLSENQVSPWTYTVPYTGLLYLNFIANARAYCGILWNGAALGDVCVTNNGSNWYAQIVTIPVAKGDTIVVSGLTTSCYLAATRCALITWG